MTRGTVVLKEREKKQDKIQSQINITRSEFQRSFRNHYTMYQKSGTNMPYHSRLLILFYSVECGLKSLILKNIGKNTYEDLKDYGAEKAWLKIQSIDESACIHRLMALEGAILGIKKFELPQIRKDELKEFYNKYKK